MFIDPDLDPNAVPPYLQGVGALDALETDWADKQTMLKMPEGRPKIDYHLVAPENLDAACEGHGESGCELSDRLQIAASTVPYQHELIHAYMELVAPGVTPLPLLIEGTAESIRCQGQADAQTMGAYLRDDVPWRQVVTEAASDRRLDVYRQGGLLVRYLIRTQGIDAFVRYFRQAPGRRDPALFATNFSAFWNMNIDDVWAAMHVVAPGAAEIDAPICPCSLPVAVADGESLDNNQATHPYWLLPETGGASLALTAPSGEAFSFSDCEGVAPYFQSNFSALQTYPDAVFLPDAALAIVQPPADGRRRYTVTPISAASIGQYIANTCGGGVPYQLPRTFLRGRGELSIIVDQTSLGGVTKYLQVQMPGIGVANLGPNVDVCDNCGFGEGACVSTSALGGPYSVVEPGAVNVQWRVPAIGQSADFPNPAGGWIQFTN